MMYFSGRVNAILFEEPSQGFYILKMLLDSDDESALVFEKPQVTVRGHIQGLVIKVGSWFGFEAVWNDHSKYGKQLAITKAPIFKGGWDPDNAEKVLVSHGVGSRVLQQIRDHYGDDEFLKVLGDKTKIEAVPGINSFTALYIVQRWETVQAYFKTLDFLNDLDLPSGKVKDVWTTFGDDAEHVLSTNPWALVRVDGISFHQADTIAMRLGLDTAVSNRVRGAVIYACKSQRNFGHLYMTTGQMFGEIQVLIPDVTKETVAQALADLHKAGDIILDRDTRQGVTAIYEPSYWKMENEAASLLRDRYVVANFGQGGLDVKPYIRQLASVGPKTEEKTKLKRPRLDKVVEIAIEEWGDAEHLKLSEKQKEGVHNALTQPISILTGLPGTGKTTSLKAVVSILQEAGVTFLLCAPTGIAAKNLSKLSGAPAYTIHRAFAAKGKSDERREATYAGITGDSERDLKGGEDEGLWGYGLENPHPAQVVVVDEASMLDQHLIYRLLTCTSPQCRMVIVGDAAQLPSVGPGNVLRDLISSGNFPVVNLTEIFRQKDTSDIVFAAHDIYHGKVPECQPPSDFSLVQVGSEDQALAVIKQLAEKLYSKRLNFQILSPRHAGTVGVTSLNVVLREMLNPQQGGIQEIRLGQDTIREDDRIMVVKNDYRLGVYNGDVGKVSRIDRKGKEIELKIFGEPPLYVRVPFKDAPRLVRLAYACTVHKCVVGTTLIPTSGGLRRIGEMASGIPVGHFTRDHWVIAGSQGWVDTDQVYAGGNQPTIRVTTRHGYSLEGSCKHPLMVMTSDGALVQRTLPEIQIGDRLVLRKGSGNTADFVKTRDFVPSQTSRERQGIIPEVLDENLGWFMGVCVGDGNQTDKVDGRIEVTQKDAAARKIIMGVMRDLWHVHPTDTGASVYLHGRKIREFLAWAGLGYEKAPKKSTPWAILQSPIAVQGAFLRGLYDTDGGVSRLIHLTTTSADLAEEVQQMLLSMGIISHRYQMRPAIPKRGWAVAYRIEITGSPDISKFHTLVGFTFAPKRKALEDLLARGTLTKSNVGDLPHGQGLVSGIHRALRLRGGRNYPEAKIMRRLSNVRHGRAPLRCTHLSWLAQEIPDLENLCPEGNQVAQFVRYGFFCDPVVDIIHGESTVYDFHVTQDDHLFVGNGFLNHNCQGLEYDVIVMPLVDSFQHQLQRNLLYTAVTRAKQKVILVGTRSALAQAVVNDREDLRNTLFKYRITVAAR